MLMETLCQREALMCKYAAAIACMFMPSLHHLGGFLGSLGMLQQYNETAMIS